MTNFSFERTFYKIIVLIILILSLLSIFLSYYLNEDFFIKYSVDNELEGRTIQNIHAIQNNLIIIGIFLLSLFILSLYCEFYIILFLKRHKTAIQNVSMILASLIIFFLIGETFFRVMLYNETSTYGFGPGSLKFNSKYVYLNSQGFRDNEFQLVKQKDIIRIAGIGDSFTYGSGIKNINNTYLNLLEDKLNNNSNIKYEVLNFAKPGMDTVDEINLLNEQAINYHPDIIILGYVLNDFEDVDNLSKQQYYEITLPYIGFWLRNFSYLYYFIETRVNRLLENLNYKVNYEDGLINSFDSNVNKDYNKMLFMNISSTAEENNIKVVLVIFPMVYNFDDYPFINAHKFLSKTGNEINFVVVDLLEDFKAYNESELVVNKYDSHPNELGHKIAAESIFETLINESEKW